MRLSVVLLGRSRVCLLRREWKNQVESLNLARRCWSTSQICCAVTRDHRARREQSTVRSKCFDILINRLTRSLRVGKEPILQLG